jgi:peroxiredoxin
MTARQPSDPSASNQEPGPEVQQSDQEVHRIEDTHEQTEPKRATRSPIIIALFAVGAIVGLCILLCVGMQVYPLIMEKMVASRLVGQEAPDFTLTTLDGDEVTLSELRGAPVVVSFWATWCPSCVQELPELQAAYQEHGDETHILTVSVDNDRSDIESFSKEKNLDFPILFDEDGAVSGSYSVRGIPVTVFVDSEGVMVKRHIGSLTEDKFAEYLGEIRQSTESTEEPD